MVFRSVIFHLLYTLFALPHRSTASDRIGQHGAVGFSLLTPPNGAKPALAFGSMVNGGYFFKKVMVFPVDGISRSSISCFDKLGTEAGN
jgi:hypothetical protein